MVTMPAILARCREYPETVPLPTKDVLAMVACIEAAIAMRASVRVTDNCPCNQCVDGRAFDRALSAIAGDAGG